jgi:hypothetical protein
MTNTNKKDFIIKEKLNIKLSKADNLTINILKYNPKEAKIYNQLTRLGF